MDVGQTLLPCSSLSPTTPNPNFETTKAPRTDFLREIGNVKTGIRCIRNSIGVKSKYASNETNLAGRPRYLANKSFHGRSAHGLPPQKVKTHTRPFVCANTFCRSADGISYTRRSTVDNTHSCS